MRLVTGFWGFKTLAAALELELFATLAGGRIRSAAELGAELGLPERATDVLLAACASLGLLERAGDGYRNTPQAEQFLVPGQRYYFGDQVRHADRRAGAWQRLTEALRTDQPASWEAGSQDSVFDTDDPQFLGSFWEAMHSTSSFTAARLAEAYDFSPHTRLLDVGGGSGACAIELCRRYPSLRATIYDLPVACRVADEKIAESGLGGRIDAVRGDFRSDPALPPGYDAILLSSILHDWDEPTGRALLRLCHAALPAGGVVVISELLLNPERTGPADAALMGMNMLVNTEGGRNYSETEYSQWLRETGFGEVTVVRFDAPGANGAVLGVKQ
ncbi:methyltransferase domain-containing protein [Natronosporangium hydrolyticum]|uniref:Methyltransferase domain-containing protein n=2 Tax=Natronosporangium hydrolyticum TaxID=2811111 RepID=A0A895YPS7_9ACTN|nr:methyltransferase domain-containing protein [Natronosporangium hydrolyticum]